MLIKSRIEVVDALRGFALLGLCLIHGLEHFDLLIYPETVPVALQAIDPVVNDIVFFLFAGKAFAIFSFMFGLSFFIQMDRQSQRGVDFRWRFLWRLALLFGIGYLFGLVYCGEILSIFAVLGVALILIDRFGTKTLLGLSALMVANIPYLYKFFVALGDPAMDPRPYAVWDLYGRAFEIFSQGSFAQVVQFNAWLGQQMKWGWYLQEGRLWQILGLFLWGMVIGRSRFFESVEEKKDLCRRTLIVAALGFLGLRLLRSNLDSFELNESAVYLADKLVSSYANLMFMIVLMSGFILLYRVEWWQRKLSVLAPLGRMSLTNYVAQSVVGVLFFYGFGLAMYQHFGHTLSLVFAIVLISLLIWASRAWIQRFHYGPLEWVWRAATFRTTDVPLVRRRQE